jgi:GTPase involved in cell partitioning and DNA repair
VQIKKGMAPMLHRKPHIENHLQSAKKRLAARHELLTANGMDTGRIYKDAQIRRFKAQVRKAKRELTEIAAVETQMAEKAELRIAKAADAQSAALQKKTKKRDRNAPPAKKRRKRRYEADEGQQSERRA